MADLDSLSRYLRKITDDIPKDAVALRSASAQVISMWIGCGFDYPNEPIDFFVYTESSIEDSIADNLNDAVALEAECVDAYAFHIRNFLGYRP